MGFLKLKKEKLVSQSAISYSKSTKVGITLTLVVVGVLALNFFSSFQLRQTVDVVMLRTSVPQDGRIIESNLVRTPMMRVEYEKRGLVRLSDDSVRRTIVLWSDRGRIIDTYATNFIRHSTAVFWDSLGRETPRRFSYLYKMDGELLKLGVPAGQFGEMLVPGDRINVRAAFVSQSFTLPSESDFIRLQQTGVRAQTTVPQQVMLFNNVVILDILNGQGESIFDIYAQVLAHPRGVQREIVNSREFKERVSPTHILLNVTPEEADMYMSIQRKSPTYMMTLLPRTGSNLITEALNELKTGFARDR